MLKTRIPICHPERKHIAKGFCKACYDKDYNTKNRLKLNKKKREWNAANPTKRKAITRKYLYGISDYQVQARLRAQDGLCKICDKKLAVHLDHNHKTGQVRSLLCADCNRALGLFREDVAVIRRAAEYIELWKDCNITVY